MSNQIYWLSREDMLALRQLIDESRAPKNRRSGELGGDADYPSSDIYVVRTPASGIAALQTYGSGTGSATEESIGYAYCQIYRVLQSTNALDPPNTFILQAVSNLNQYVYSLIAVAGDTWVPVGRDKFGTWFVLGGGGGSTPDVYIYIQSDIPQTVYLGRAVTDGKLTLGSTVFQSASANFTDQDIGSVVYDKDNPNILPENTTIQSLDSNNPPNAILSNAAMADTATNGDHIAIASSTILGYPAIRETWSRESGTTISDLTGPSNPPDCWWYDINQYNIGTIIQMAPATFKLKVGYLTTDVFGIPVYGGGPYYGASGTDGLGNIFVDGICINIGGAGVSNTVSGSSSW